MIVIGKYSISPTTLNGYLSAIMCAAGPICAYLATIHQPWAAGVSGFITMLAAIARIWSGSLQGDAPPKP